MELLEPVELNGLNDSNGPEPELAELSLASAGNAASCNL
jgi:hypothetical protein